MKKYSGFSVIELMVVLAVAAIIVGIAIPGMVQFLAERSLVSDVSKFNVAVAFARSEAVTRGQPVTLCPSGNGATCDATLQWQDGWIVFRDINGDGAVDLGTDTCAATEDCILRTDEGMKVNSLLNADQNRMQFNARGERAAGSATVISLCHPDAQRIHTVRVSASGSASVSIATGVCS